MKTILMILKRILIAGILLAALGLVGLFFGQDYVLYPARGLVHGETTDNQRRMESLANRGYLATEVDGQGGYKVKGLWSEVQAGAPALLWFHARDENMTAITQILVPLRELGYHVFVMEYRGYGSSGAATRQADILGDAEAVYDFLAAKDTVSRGKVFAGGVEMGANLALQLATRKGVGAVVAVSTMPDMATALKEKIPAVPLGFLLRDKWDVRPSLPQVGCPVLFVHGTADKVVPMSEVEELGTKIKAGKVSFQWVEDGGHSGALDKGGKGVYEAIDAFLSRASRR